MIKIIAKKDFTMNGDLIEEKTDLTSKIKDISEIVRLNEKGFIEPLTFKDIVQLKKELENPKNDFKFEKEEE